MSQANIIRSSSSLKASDILNPLNHTQQDKLGKEALNCTERKNAPVKKVRISAKPDVPEIAERRRSAKKIHEDPIGRLAIKYTSPCGSSSASSIETPNFDTMAFETMHVEKASTLKIERHHVQTMVSRIDSNKAVEDSLDDNDSPIATTSDYVAVTSAMKEPGVSPTKCPADNITRVADPVTSQQTCRENSLDTIYRKHAHNSQTINNIVSTGNPTILSPPDDAGSFSVSDEPVGYKQREGSKFWQTTDCDSQENSDSTRPGLDSGSNSDSDSDDEKISPVSSPSKTGFRAGKNAQKLPPNLADLFSDREAHEAHEALAATQGFYKYNSKPGKSLDDAKGHISRYISDPSNGTSSSFFNQSSVAHSYSAPRHTPSVRASAKIIELKTFSIIDGHESNRTPAASQSFVSQAGHKWPTLDDTKRAEVDPGKALCEVPLRSAGEPANPSARFKNQPSPDLLTTDEAAFATPSNVHCTIDRSNHAARVCSPKPSNTSPKSHYNDAKHQDLTSSKNNIKEDSSLDHDIVPTEPLNFLSSDSATLTEPPDLCLQGDSPTSSSSDKLTQDFQQTPATKSDSSPYEYHPGNKSYCFDWSPYCPAAGTLQNSADDEDTKNKSESHDDSKIKQDCNDYDDDMSSKSESESENESENEIGSERESESDSDSGSGSESDSGSEIEGEHDPESHSEIYYKYRNEGYGSITKTQYKVKQRLTKKGIKKRQRLFPDKHGIHYEKLKFHQPYRTTTFEPSNVNLHLEQFIPSIVDQRKYSTAKRLKQNPDTLTELYKLPPEGVIKFGDTEVIKFDKEGEIVPLKRSGFSKKHSSDELRPILKPTQKESPTEWDTLVGDDEVKHKLARIFNICNIPLELLSDSLESVLEKIGAAIIVECGNKEYFNNYQSLYDEVKFEEYNRIMKGKIKELKKLLKNSIGENEKLNALYKDQLMAHEQQLESQNRDFEEAMVNERKQFERATYEDFEEFEHILKEERKVFEESLSKERKDFEVTLLKEREYFENALNRESEEHASILENTRREHFDALKKEREQHEQNLERERMRITKIENKQSSLFNAAVEEFRVRERVALDQAKSMGVEVERGRIEHLKAQNEIKSLSMQNEELKESIQGKRDYNMKIKSEADTLKIRLTKQEQRENRHKDRYIAVYENLERTKQELKNLKDTNLSLSNDNQKSNDLIVKLQANVIEFKENIEDCRENIEVVKSQIVHGKRIYSRVDKRYQELNENFLTLANVHFPLQNAYKSLLTKYDELQKIYKETWRENQRKERDIQRISEQLTKANEKIKQARKSARGEFIYVAEEDDKYESVLHMPLEFLKEKDVAPAPVSIPTVKIDPKFFPDSKLAPIAASHPTQFPTVEELCGSPSKRGTKRKILRSLANKMSMSHNNLNDRNGKQICIAG